MKTCEEYQELVSAYSDDELNDAEISELFFHLGECADCRAFMKSVLQLRSTLQEATVPVSITTKAMPSSLWKRKLSVSYSVAAAILLMMLLSGALFFQKMMQQPKVVEKTQTEYVYM